MGSLVFQDKNCTNTRTVSQANTPKPAQKQLFTETTAKTYAFSQAGTPEPAREAPMEKKTAKTHVYFANK